MKLADLVSYENNARHNDKAVPVVAESIKHYTARHEFGHPTQFSISNKTGKSASQIRDEVRAIAAMRYGATKSLDPSRYGGYNEIEYFSESYASMTGGRPNAHGKALKAWMK